MDAERESPLDRNRGLVTDSQQQALRNSCILIAGVGGVGGRVAETLARMGIGRLKLTDPDVFSTSNLNRQAAASTESMGLNKAHVVGMLCESVGTGTVVESDDRGITASNLDRALAGVDLVIDGTDYTQPHIGLMLARAARARDIPLLLAVEVGFSVWHTTFSPHGQTFEKFFGLPRTVEPDDLETGRASIPLWRWVMRIPRYADISTLEKVNAGTMAAPAIAPAVELSAGLLATAAVATLTGHRPVAIAPNVHRVDLWTGESTVGRTTRLGFQLSAVANQMNRKRTSTITRRSGNETTMTPLDSAYAVVLELATRAPSAHNSQPWRLRAVAGDRVELVYLPDERLPYDPDHRDAYLALGAYLETVTLVAGSRRIAVHFEPSFAVVGQCHEVGSLRFEENVANAIDPLARVVHRRHTNRRPYRRSVPSPELRSELASLGNQALFGPDIRDLVTKANVASWGDPQFLTDLGKWTSSDPGAPDGLTRQSLCLTNAEWTLLRGAIRAGRLPRLVGHFFSSSEVELFGADHSLIYVLGAESLDPRDTLEAGRRLLRSWCTLAGHGWSAHPVSALVDRPEARDRLARISGIATPVAVYRAGVPTAPVAISNRRPVVLTT